MNDYDATNSALNAAGIDIHSDFFTLSQFQVCTLVYLAKQQKYRKPKSANGSTARYFFARLQRQANRV